MRLIVVVTAIGIALGLPAVAFATEEEPLEPAVTTTVDPSAPQPAEEVPVAEDEAEEQPWTARFLTPALIVGTIVLVVGLLFYYLLRIRGRYRVVGQP